MQGRPALWDAIQQPEEQGDDVEAFADAPDSDAEGDGKPAGPSTADATAASLMYDMQKRWVVDVLAVPWPSRKPVST